MDRGGGRHLNRVGDEMSGGGRKILLGRKIEKYLGIREDMRGDLEMVMAEKKNPKNPFSTLSLKGQFLY